MSKEDTANKKSPQKAAHKKPNASVSFGGQTYRYTDITKVHPALKSFLCYGLSKVANRKKMQLEKALEPLDLHAIHVGIMRILHDGGDEITQNQLSDEVGLDKATMVKVVDHLENRGLVKRAQSQKDRRANFITLTEKGKKVLLKAVKVSDDVESSFFDKLTAQEVKTLRALISRLLD
jgi:DNA-binding MarR family transcriptional regulator